MLGLFPAFLAGLVLNTLVAQNREELEQRFRALQVTVAARELKAGEILVEADLDTRAIPTQLVSGSLVLWDWREMAAGQRLLADVPRGELLRWSDFDPGRDAPTLALREGTVGVNVDVTALPELLPGARVRLRRLGKYTGMQSELVDEARVVAVDGTTGPEPGPDEKNDAVRVALLELSPDVAARVIAADVHRELVVEPLPSAEVRHE